MDLTALPDKVKELVRAQIETGHFSSVDEFVRGPACPAVEREELFASHCEQLTDRGGPGG